jgi:hypothetical protein
MSCLNDEIYIARYSSQVERSSIINFKHEYILGKFYPLYDWIGTMVFIKNSNVNAALVVLNYLAKLGLLRYS